MLSSTPTLKPEAYNMFQPSTPTLLTLNNKKIKEFLLEERKPLVLKKRKKLKKPKEEDEGIKSNKELLENLSQLRTDLCLDRCDEDLSTVEFTDELEDYNNNYNSCIFTSTGGDSFLPSFNNMDLLNKFIDEQEKKKIDSNQIKTIEKICQEPNKNNVPHA